MPIPTEITLRGADTPSGERFNYTGMHRYLITLPAHGTGAAFTRRELVTSVLDALREASWHHHFDIYAYCFLPDRLLLLIRGKEESSHMKQFLREFRTTSDAALATALGHPLWGKKYLERVLRKTEITSEAARALFVTPVKLGLAPTPREYSFQGSFVRDTALLFGPPEGPARQGQSRPGSSRPGSSRPGSPRPGSSRPGSPRQGQGRRGPPGPGQRPQRPGKPKGKARR